MKTQAAVPTERLDATLRRVRAARVADTGGRVVQVIGLVIESEGPIAAVGEVCRVESARQDGSTLAEVVGFRDHHLLLMPLGELQGIHPGSEVVATGLPMSMSVGEALKGRVLDGLGKPLDGLGPISTEHTVGLNLLPPHPLKRQPIHDVFQTGVRAIDTFIPCGRGQRLGVFAGSGAGQSALLGTIASHAEADVNVIALIGGRGREVREFLERELDEAGRRKSVIIVATSNEPALHRVKAAFLAMAVAEHFRDNGRDVLLVMDSVTHLAMAQREIGFAVGEPQTSCGYPPSVFSLLPQLFERAGTGEQGAMTSLFTVFVEDHDRSDPIAEATRSLLDGHIVLSSELAAQNHYPAIDVLASVSQLSRNLLSSAQRDLAAAAREHLAVYHKNRNLIDSGAYAPGSHCAVERAIALREPLNRFLRQGVRERTPASRSWSMLEDILSPATPANAPSSTNGQPGGGP